MKNDGVIVFVFLALVVSFIFARIYRNNLDTQSLAPGLQPSPAPTEANPLPVDNSGQPQVVAQNLDTPWAIAFLPDGNLLVTQRQGTVMRVDSQGKAVNVAKLNQVREAGEGGLLGIALHPQFAANHFVYVYYTYNSRGNDTSNRVVRLTYDNQTLKDEQVVVDQIPGASNHNGGRIKFGPDNNLYIATGDAQEPSQAQNPQSLAGKILRVTDTGAPASGNPFNNQVYSLGHRNVQGLAWDNQGNLWATEHGRSGAASGLDELNLITVGGNYGWPEIQGDETRPGMITPVRHSGADTTWAPAGLAFHGSALYFGGLRGEALYQAQLNQSQVTAFNTYYSGRYGRIREVIMGPDGLLYFTTSNRDGRGRPQSADDQVLRANPNTL